MKLKLAITILSLYCIFMVGKGGESEFIILLTRGYRLSKTSNDNIIVTPWTYYEDTPIIPSKVVEIAWNDNFVIAKRQKMRLWNRFSGDKIQIPIPDSYDYWIFNFTEKQPLLLGPLNIEDFKNKQKKLGITLVLEKIENISKQPAPWDPQIKDNSR